MDGVSDLQGQAARIVNKQVNNGHLRHLVNDNHTRDEETVAFGLFSPLIIIIRDFKGPNAHFVQAIDGISSRLQRAERVVPYPIQITMICQGLAIIENNRAS